MEATKICFILGSLWPKTTGGSEYQVSLLIDELKKAGNFELSYIYTDRAATQQEVDGIKYFTVRKRFRKLGTPYFLDFFRIQRILNRIKPDIIYQRSGSALTGIAAYYAKKNKIAMIWHIAHKNEVKLPGLRLSDFRFPFDFCNRKFMEYGIKNAGKIIGQAHYQDELLQKNYHRSCDLITANFHPQPESAVQKTGPVKIVWAANYKKWKQPELYIECAEQFASQKDIVFFMIGRPKNSSWQDKIQHRADKLDNFFYLGEKPIEEVNRILGEAHLFINTSWSEGFPNTFIQAWMRRVPVISLHVDPDGLIQKNGIGRLSASFSQMVKDVEYLIENHEAREAMGEKAQKFAFQTFSLNNTREIIRLMEKKTQE